MQHPSAARLVVLAGLAACASAPPPLALPPVAPIVSHARLADVAAEERSPQSLHIEIVAVRDEPSGPAVDMVAESITRERGAPFRGAGSLPPGSRWLCGDDAARWLASREQGDSSRQQVLGAVDTVLAIGLQTSVHTGLAGMPDVVLTPQATAVGHRTSVELASAAGGGREHLHVREPLAADDRVVLFVPALVRDPAGFALVLQTSAPPPADVVAGAIASATPPPAAVDPWPAPWREALRAVGEHERRPALLALARTLHAPRCIDVLLVADERALVDTTQALSAMGPDAALAVWPFERAMWRAMLARLERDELPAALQAALWRHLGALADDAGSLRLLLTAADDDEAFTAAVRDENLAALADGDAARRVRAHDWLQGHGSAVPDFDPLAPVAQRRAALRRHAATAANPEPAR